MNKPTRYWLTCSRCGKRFSGLTRTEALNKIRKHMWKEHRDWMIKRIKAGQKKASKVKIVGLPASVLNPSWIGFAEKSGIEKVTGLPYEEVKSRVLDFMVSMVLGGIKKP
ncbi:hypothetical protein ES705_43688 [subsurface metagenome]